MKPIAVFYHVKLSGGNPPVADGHPIKVMAEQMKSLSESGLAAAAQELFIGVNNATILEEAMPFIPAKATIVCHGEDANTEVPTLHFLQQWLVGKHDWNVCYFHAKGARNSVDPLLSAWRNCMMRHVIKNWSVCVQDLEQFESVGCHWLTPEAFQPAVREPFWGGNFWWCRSAILNTLPPLPKNMMPGMDYYMAERWIGWGQRPTIKDYAPHWPNLVQCAQS